MPQTLRPGYRRGALPAARRAGLRRQQRAGRNHLPGIGAGRRSRRRRGRPRRRPNPPAKQKRPRAADAATSRAARHSIAATRIQEVIKRNQIVLVQVIKEERGNKGCSLTTYISLAGRSAVLMPNSPKGGGISRKITDRETRRRLKEVASEMRTHKGMSVIIRTAGLDRTKAGHPPRLRVPRQAVEPDPREHARRHRARTYLRGGQPGEARPCATSTPRTSRRSSSRASPPTRTPRNSCACSCPRKWAR